MPGRDRHRVRSLRSLSLSKRSKWPAIAKVSHFIQCL